MCKNYILKSLYNPSCSLPTILEKYRRFQVHEINKGRSEFGEYFTLFPLLKKHEDRFKQYTRMKIKTFFYILAIISPFLQKDWCNLHTQPIEPEQALVITLRFLASGLSYHDLAFSFRMGVSTIHGILKRTMTCLWEKLYPIHMPVPTEEDFVIIAKEFYKWWQFPNCLGAIDVRHVRIKRPYKTGSLYYNYKMFYSIAFQAVVGPNGKYICIDVGGYGRQHDSTTFFASQFYAALKLNLIKLPADAALPNSSVVLPFFFVGDGAYPLMEHLMKPYAGKDLTTDEEALNKRLSRARMVCECAFGRTCQKFQIFHKLIQCSPGMVKLICKSTALLHNVIIDLEGNQDCANLSKDDLTALRKIKRKESPNADNFPVGKGNKTREALKNFVKSNPMTK